MGCYLMQFCMWRETLFSAPFTCCQHWWFWILHFTYTDGESDKTAEIICGDERVHRWGQFTTTRESEFPPKVNHPLASVLKMSNVCVSFVQISNVVCVFVGRWTSCSRRTWSWCGGSQLRRNLSATVTGSWINARQSARPSAGSWRRLYQTSDSRYISATV